MEDCTPARIGFKKKRPILCQGDVPSQKREARKGGRVCAPHKHHALLPEWKIDANDRCAGVRMMRNRFSIRHCRMSNTSGFAFDAAENPGYGRFPRTMRQSYERGDEPRFFAPIH